MAGKTPPKSVAAFVEPIKDALGCFAKCKVLADVHDPGKRGVLTVNGLEPVDLNGNAAVAIQISLRYEIVEDPERGPWKVKTLGYSHRVLLDGAEECDYHWHPISDSHEKLPHAHLKAFPRCHIPTGRIMVEDVLRLAIELGARPRDVARWREIDAANREKFKLGATWGVGPAS